MPPLFSNAYASLNLDQSVVWYARNSVPFPSAEELVQSHADVARVLDRLGRARYALLVDLREARAVSAATEHAMDNERKRLLFGFARVAVLVKTAAGALEVRRDAKADGIDVRVFIDDERGALAYARLGGPVNDAFSSGVIEVGPIGSSMAPLSSGRLGRRSRG